MKPSTRLQPYYYSLCLLSLDGNVANQTTASPYEGRCTGTQYNIIIPKASMNNVEWNRCAYIYI